MSWFSAKQEVDLEAFCQKFYESRIFEKNEADQLSNTIFADVILKELNEAAPLFSSVDRTLLKREVACLQLELFALAWTHKYISGKPVLQQSSYTKQYLVNSGKNDIWEGMGIYSQAINDGTLSWWSSLGNFNAISNNRMRDSLMEDNLKDARELGLIETDDCVARVNLRTWSENAWQQKYIYGGLIVAFCINTNVDILKLKEDDIFRLSVVFRGMYENAQQSWKEVNIQ